MLPQEADIDPVFWGYCIGGYIVSVDVAEAFARNNNIDVLHLIERFRSTKREEYDSEMWCKVGESATNASRRISNWLLDRHPDDFASLPFPGVQVEFMYWIQLEREKWNARQPDVDPPPKLADGWYLLFKCRNAYTLDELVRVDSPFSIEETEKRKFREYLLDDLQVLGPEPGGRERDLVWASLFDYSGLCFIWFKPGQRKGDMTFHAGPEAKKAFLEKLRRRLREAKEKAQ